MSSLTGKKIKDTYKDLLHLGNSNSGLTTTTIYISSGDGDEAPLGLSTSTIGIKGHILPETNAAFDIGSAEKKIRHLFLSDNSLYVGNTKVEETFFTGLSSLIDPPVDSSMNVLEGYTAEYIKQGDNIIQIDLTDTIGANGRSVGAVMSFYAYATTYGVTSPEGNIDESYYDPSSSHWLTGTAGQLKDSNGTITGTVENLLWWGAEGEGRSSEFASLTATNIVVGDMNMDESYFSGLSALVPPGAEVTFGGSGQYVSGTFSTNSSNEVDEITLTYSHGPSVTLTPYSNTWLDIGFPYGKVDSEYRDAGNSDFFYFYPNGVGNNQDDNGVDPQLTWPVKEASPTFNAVTTNTLTANNITLDDGGLGGIQTLTPSWVVDVKNLLAGGITSSTLASEISGMTVGHFPLQPVVANLQSQVTTLQSQVTAMQAEIDELAGHDHAPPPTPTPTAEPSISFELSFNNQYTDDGSGMGWQFDGSGIYNHYEIGLTFTEHPTRIVNNMPTYFAAGTHNTNVDYFVAWADSETDPMGNNWAGWTLYYSDDDGATLTKLFLQYYGMNQGYIIAAFIDNAGYWNQSTHAPYGIGEAFLPHQQSWTVDYDGMGSYGDTGDQYEISFDNTSSFSSDNAGNGSMMSPDDFTGSRIG